MPTVRVNAIDMYYEIHGEGEPVVLIAGLNSDHTLYREIIPRLAERYQVVAFDNWGMGQTDKPDIPYSIEMMANDTAGLLHALGITQAHIPGRAHCCVPDAPASPAGQKPDPRFDGLEEPERNTDALVASPGPPHA